MNKIKQRYALAVVISFLTACPPPPSTKAENEQCPTIPLAKWKECGGCGPIASVAIPSIEKSKQWAQENRSIEEKSCLESAAAKLDGDLSLTGKRVKLASAKLDGSLEGCIAQYTNYKDDDKSVHEAVTTATRIIEKVFNDTDAYKQWATCVYGNPTTPKTSVEGAQKEPSELVTVVQEKVDAEIMIKEAMRLTTEGLLSTYPCVFLNIGRGVLNQGCSGKPCSPTELTRDSNDLLSLKDFSGRCKGLLLPQLKFLYGVDLPAGSCDINAAALGLMAGTTMRKITKYWFETAMKNHETITEMKLQKLMFLDGVSPEKRSALMATLMQRWIKQHQFNSNATLQNAMAKWKDLNAVCSNKDCSNWKIAIGKEEGNFRLTDEFYVIAGILYGKILEKYSSESLNYQPTCTNLFVQWNDGSKNWDTTSQCSNSSASTKKEEFRCFGNPSVPSSTTVASAVNVFLDGLDWKVTKEKTHQRGIAERQGPL